MTNLLLAPPGDALGSFFLTMFLTIQTGKIWTNTRQIEHSIRAAFI